MNGNCFYVTAVSATAKDELVEEFGLVTQMGTVDKLYASETQFNLIKNDSRVKESEYVFEYTTMEV
jgi:hypothetical protein